MIFRCPLSRRLVLVPLPPAQFNVVYSAYSKAYRVQFVSPDVLQLGSMHWGLVNLPVGSAAVGCVPRLELTSHTLFGFGLA